MFIECLSLVLSNSFKGERQFATRLYKCGCRLNDVRLVLVKKGFGMILLF